MIGATTNNNSRIVEKIVPPARTLNGFLDKSFHRRKIGHIYFHRLRFANPITSARPIPDATPVTISVAPSKMRIVLFDAIVPPKNL
jgi:hypothetical protein